MAIDELETTLRHVRSIAVLRVDQPAAPVGGRVGDEDLLQYDVEVSGVAIVPKALVEARVTTDDRSGDLGARCVPMR